MLRKRKRHSCVATFSAVLLLLCCSLLYAQDVPPQYRQYFVKYTDKRSIAEKVFNIAGVTNADVGRSFALICGISKYPKMKGEKGDLVPAAEDIRKLQRYLKRYEFFDEIVVLRNEQVTLPNLEYFLQTYFSARLKKFPKSRFLFAYSGHGMTENNKGYLLKSTARNLKDKGHALHINVLKVYIDEVVAAGHQVLVLLNSCHSGTFLKRPYGEVVLLPKYRGAHAITAGGPSELAWHIDEVGSGSIFYEKLLAGISGIADVEKDGIVTACELHSYLKREIQMVTDQGQNPQMGDISLHGSLGEFFFLNRDTSLVQQKRVKISGGTSMGISVEEVVVTPPAPVQSKPVQPKTWTEPITGMEFVRVEGGCFQMGQMEKEKKQLIAEVGQGDYDSYFEDELPRHKVCVDDFWMAKYEVTNRQFRLFRPEHDSGEYKGKSLNGEKQPVVEVSREDARDYAVWLARQSGKKIRLPTEAEWEYAARAGTDTARFWGDAADDACRYANVADQTAKKSWPDWTIHNCDDGYAVSASIGSFWANAFGLHDMLGNVWEWCADWYGEDYYASSSKDNPTGPSSGSYRVIRGGSWYDDPGCVRSANRSRSTPDRRGNGLGFRLALPVQQGRNGGASRPLPRRGAGARAADRLRACSEQRFGAKPRRFFCPDGAVSISSG
ncbi:hypothetical protein KKHLCK_00220 [Candidatus Electrothrix laxa]